MNARHGVNAARRRFVKAGPDAAAWTVAAQRSRRQLTSALVNGGAEESLARRSARRVLCELARRAGQRELLTEEDVSEAVLVGLVGTGVSLPAGVQARSFLDDMETARRQGDLAMTLAVDSYCALP